MAACRSVHRSGLPGRPGLGGLRGEPAVDLRVRQAIWHRTSAFVVCPLVTVAIPAAWHKWVPLP